MTYTVVIRHVASGEERAVKQDGAWDDVADYMWLEGNYACDCNRALFFYNWGAESDDRECGDTAFIIPRAILDDGSMIELETNPPNTPSLN